jgi:hypothetical protein
MMKSKQESTWVTKDGELIIKSPSQLKLSQSAELETVRAQFLFFKSIGNEERVTEIRENMEHSMQIAYERDSGLDHHSIIETTSPRVL